MRTLADLEAQPAPSRVTLSGPRMSGTIPVRFARASDWSRVVCFGDDLFGTDNTIRINGIDCTIAGLTIIEQQRTWQRHSYRFLRRAGTIADATPAAVRAVGEWAERTAGELAERHPDAFTALSLSRRDRAASLTATAERLASDAAICRAYADTHVAIDDGHTTTVAADDIGALRWVVPDSRREINDSLLYARQPAPAVATVCIGDRPIAYLVDARSNHGGRPDTQGGLVVPIELARPA